MARRHLRTGGVMVTYPDQCKENFKQNQTTIWRSKRGDLDITFIENNYDPNPRDNTFESTFVFLIRKKNKLKIEHDFHTGGLFRLSVWRKLLRQAGFKAYEEEQKRADSGPTFVCVKSV